MAFIGHRKSCLSLIQTLIGVVLTTTKPRSSSVAEVIPTYSLFDDHGNLLKKEIVQAWRLVRTKGRRLLGKHLCISLDPYLQWVRVRAFKLRMPYQHQ